MKNFKGCSLGPRARTRPGDFSIGFAADRNATADQTKESRVVLRDDVLLLQR